MNRWLYISVVAVMPNLLAVVSAFTHEPLFLAAAQMLVGVLTYPVGALGTLVTMPMLYLGIATTEEWLFITSLVVAPLGFIQWYVLLPRLASRIVARQQRALTSHSSGPPSAAAELRR